jgi:hypothetical protein
MLDGSVCSAASPSQHVLVAMGAVRRPGALVAALHARAHVGPSPDVDALLAAAARTRSCGPRATGLERPR